MPSEPVYPPSGNPGPAGSPPPPPYLSPGTGQTTTGLAPNVAAGLAVLVTFITGIIFLVLEKRSQFVRFWAMQATVFGLGLFVFNIALWILGLILGHIPVLGWILGVFLFLLSMVVYLGAFVLWIIMLIKAFSGEEWSAPVIGRIAREQLAKFPA